MSIIYLDFETTGVKATPPALLGVLLPDGSIRQYVVDPNLWPAAVAQETCFPATLPEAVDEVIREAGAMEAPLCAWSTFDLGVIDGSPEVPAPMKKAFDARYFNALTIVPTWAQVLYGFKPMREGFDPARSLKKYVAFFGCPWPSRLRDPKPAAWIQHLRRQLKAKDDHYGRVTHQAKRDWHRLLGYNRADLLALQGLVSRADHEMMKLAAYRETTYRVFVDGRDIAFKIDSHKRRLDALLARGRATQWALITAWNPGTAVLTEPENRARQARLVADATNLRLELLRGDGRQTGGEGAEESVFILGISERRAVALGQKYGQWAIVVGTVGAPARLVWCRTARLDRPGQRPQS